MKIKIAIVGCGRRVMQDVIPSLLNVGINKNEIKVYGRSSRILVVRDQVFNVEKLPNKLPNVLLVYICLPVAQVTKFLFNHQNCISGKDVLIDTPFLFDKKLFKNTKQTSVCEDVVPLIKYFEKYIKIKNKFNFIYFKNSFFKYHGVAFVEALLGKIFLSLNFYKIRFFVASKGCAFSIGSKNYEIGNIYINGIKLSIPELSNKEIELIGGLTDISTFSSRFLDLKRIGLSHVFLNYRNTGLLNCCSIDSAIFHNYISSKKIYIGKT